MNLDSLNISLDMAEAMLPCVEGRLRVLKEEWDKLEKESRELLALKTEIQAALHKRTVTNQPTTKGQDRKRLAKGAGDIVVFNLLNSLPVGQGLSIADVVKKTGVNRATVHRTFHDPKRNNGRFIQIGDTWKLKAK